MDDASITRLLRSSAPTTVAADAAVRIEIDRMAERARAVAHGRRRARRRVAIVALPALAIIPGALVFTGGTDVRQVPDLTIPMTYVTDTGTSIACEVDLFNGETDYVETNLEAVAYFAAQDWSGVGQRVYDLALRYEDEGRVSPWAQAENDVLLAGAPDIFTDGGMGMTSTCTGALH
ncbi:hypothetical protein GCM10009846_08740 [Agrococcus versicolor]|uniref:Uncharacterized protein n=1 Tax=Agrococcus versicolor TaxID=501482 RepID=A0ABN3AMN6_9MICO